MKLASLEHGRDGRLVVVSDDLTRATDAFPIVATLQGALEDWERLALRLADLAEALQHGSVPSFRFHEHDCAAPLPRAYQRLAGRAYGGAGGPQIRQAASDRFSGPRQPIRAESEDWGIDIEASLAVITGDVPMGISAAEAQGAIRLVLLGSETYLRTLPSEEDEQAGGVQARPLAAFSPVAVTLDALGTAWRDGRLHTPLLVQINGRPFGRPDAGIGMSVDFGALIAEAARTRPLSAGTIVGAGAVGDGVPSEAIDEGGVGHASIAALRRAETLRAGKPQTPYLRFGDRVRVETKDGAGRSVFGAIEQEVLPTG